MNTRMTTISFLASAFLFIAITVSMAHARMIERDNEARFRGVSEPHATGKAGITRDNDVNSIIARTDISVDSLPDEQVYPATGNEYAKGLQFRRLTQFPGTGAIPIPAGLDIHQYQEAFRGASGFQLIGW